jgi:hypothetical protein
MIIVRLAGGLGNQMFQYALGRHLALLNNTELKLDIYSLIATIHRPFLLNYFNIKAEIASKKEISKLTSPIYYFGYTRFNNILSRLIRRFIKPEKYFTTNSFYSEKIEFFFDKKILELEGSYYLYGHWQNPNYFNNIKNILIEDFTLKKGLNNDIKSVAKTMKEVESVSVHIRRGDYINNPNNLKLFSILSKEYYLKAYQVMKQKNANPYFYVFSDDIPWCKKNLVFDSPTFYSNADYGAYSDFFLMSQCRHNIMANSTFSWWAAYLNQNREKIVIAPNKWFNDNRINTSDLAPDGWIKL